MTNFNVKVFDVFSHDIVVDAIDVTDARKKAADILASGNIEPDLTYQYTVSPDLWEVSLNDEPIKGTLTELIDDFLEVVLNDDEGISINAYSSLCELAAKTGNLDIINKIRIQDDRCYIKGESDEV